MKITFNEKDFEEYAKKIEEQTSKKCSKSFAKKWLEGKRAGFYEDIGTALESDLGDEFKMIVEEEKSNDIINITELERDVIEHGFGDNEYNDVGDPVWSWSIQPNCKIVTEKQISGVIGSLVKKGLAVAEDWSSDGKTTDDSTVELTEEGKKILNTYKDN